MYSLPQSQIDQFVMHTLSDPSVAERLSTAELSYASAYDTFFVVARLPISSAPLSHHLCLCRGSYADMIGHAFYKSFLEGIPLRHQGIIDREMIDKPNLHKHVVFRVKEHIGNFQSAEPDQYLVAIELNENDIVVGRFNAFRELLGENRIDLI